MSDKLLERLRYGDHFERVTSSERAADRIEELQARVAELEAANRGLVRLNETTEARAKAAEEKLAKAVEALERIDEASNHYCMTPTYSEGTLRYAHKSTRNLARTTIAKLTGGKDE